MSNPRCKNPTICPLCAGPHAKAEHRCPNPTCPRGGNLKPVFNCCIASPARCPNYSEDHSASYRDCTASPVPPPVLPLTPQRRKTPHLPPSIAHLNQPPAHFLQLTRMLWTFSRTKQGSPLPVSHPPPQALSPRWSLLPQEPLFVLRSWVPRDPPPGLVTPNPMGSPAPPLPPEISRPRAGKCLAAHPLHLGAGPPHATCPLFSTTASGAGMCFSPCLILLLQLSAPLM